MVFKKYRVYILLSVIGLASFLAAGSLLFFRLNDPLSQTILIISMILAAVIIGCQILFATKPTMAPALEDEADERVRIMLDATPMICSLWDEEGKLLDCNKETLKILGFSEKKEYFEHFFEVSPEYQPNGDSSRDAMQQYTKQAIKTGYVRYEWMACTAKGEPLPLDAIIVRVPWKDSWRLATYARDLREIKAKEALLRETEERHRLMLDTMAFACMFFETVGEPVDCNQRAVGLFGCKNKEEFLKDFFKLSPEYQPDGARSREKIEKILLDVFNTGKKTILWDHIKADGTPMPVEATLMRAQWKDGYRVISYLRDLSLLVETEDKLRRVLATTEASPNLILFLGPGGNIEYMNPAVSDVSGFSQELLRKEGLSLIFNKDDYERLNREYISAALKKQAVSFEMTVVPKNGGELDFSFSVFSAQMNDGSTGLGLLGRDITELKQIQRELAAAKEQAERALASEVQYNKAKSDFLSRVSHELLTPLNAIIGITQIAEQEQEKNLRLSGQVETHNYSAQVKGAAEHLLDLVNDILDMTGLDSGRFSFKPQPFSFSRAMNQIIENITEKAKAKEQVLTVNIDSGIHDLVLSDERRLKKVIQKLLLNAVKFTPEKGKIEFSAKMLNCDENKCTIRFEVIDNGIGIAPQALEHIWGVFEQADNSITRSYGGIGLGLPLTKRIVDLMEGELRVESEPGKGSRFICDVRLGVVTDTPEKKDIQDDMLADLTGKRILIVDDMEINREILASMLEDSGAVIDKAQNGNEAVKMFSQNKYDLLLIDLHMPVMDGFTASKIIRATDFAWAKTIPIISVSAESNPELHAKCKDAGISDHLPKPVEMEPLRKIIAKWLPKNTISEKQT